MFPSVRFGGEDSVRERYVESIGQSISDEVSLSRQDATPIRLKMITSWWSARAVINLILEQTDALIGMAGITV
jgi:hypothetical protein